MPSSSARHYTRFIPSEEIGDVTQWRFGAVDGSEPVEPPAEAVAEAELPEPVFNEAELQARIEQACAAAHAHGVAEGQAQAGLEWQQRMDDYIAGQGHDAAERIDRIAQTLGRSLEAMQQGIAQEVLRLACDIARQVVRQELSDNPNALLPVVREALGMLVAEGRPATVRLNPEDWETLEQPLREEFNTAKVQWVADANVQPGDCLVESAGTVVDGSLDKRWRRATAALGLQSAWAEEGEDEHG